jgi:hypothetical protein
MSSWRSTIEFRPSSELFHSRGARLYALVFWVGVRQMQFHLAQELRADLFLCDDRKARVAAKEAGLACRGILGIFLQAKKVGMIDSVAAAIRQVESKGGLYLSEEVKLETLRLAGE